MSEMVERVGEALRVKLIEWYAGGIGFEDGGPMLARAAIEAMREPTSDMVIVGYHRAKPYLGTETMRQSYRAIIQAALGDG